MSADNEADSFMIDAQIHAHLHAQLAEALAPLPMPAERAARLQQRLTARIAQSAERHRGLHTVRAGDGQWQALANGVRARVLHDNGATRSALVEFAPGAHLPGHRHRAHEECVVLRGSLQTGDCHIGVHGYHLAPAGSRHARIQSPHGALAFLRGTSIGNTRDMLREVAAGLLPGGGPGLNTIAAGSDGWREIAAGVFVKPLWLDGDQASMLVRLAAGARLPARPQAVEAECLMLSGEAFFGDILLRGGEYQRAPLGTHPGDAYSDAGALFYVHGDAAFVRAG